MTRQRVVNVDALRTVVARERARLGPLAGGGTVAIPLDDLDGMADELELARDVTGLLAELAGDAVAALVVAAAPETMPLERTRIRKRILPELISRLPANRRPGLVLDPKADHVEHAQGLTEGTADAIAEAIERSGQEGKAPDDHA